MKKIIAIAMLVILTLTAVVGGTLAYFTDTDSDVNVMTVGNVQIEQNEQQRDENGELEDFEQGQDVKPVVAPDGTGKKETLPVGDYEVDVRDDEKVKNYTDKIVTVTNTGASDAYVRTIFAFPTAGYNSGEKAYAEWLHWNAVSDSDTETKNGWMWGTADQTDPKIKEWPGNSDNWYNVDGVYIGGVQYDLYVATNVNKLAPGETTAPSLLGFYLDETLGYDQNGYYFMPNGVKTYINDISDMKILVATQAVQTDGFEDAWTALKEAFGDITEVNHPWSSTNVVNVTSGTYYLDSVITVSDDATDVVTASGANTEVIIEGGYYDVAGKDCAVWAMDGATVTINDGHFICNGLGEEATSDNHQDMIYAGANGGKIFINGGFFEARSEGAWLLNEKDGQGKIVVYGGTFVNWNPANNVSEGANTSFLAEGCKVVEAEQSNGDIWYTVVAE